MTDDEIRELLATDFEAYAAHCLKIATKGASLQPFILNKPQRHVLSVINRQMKEKGYARIILLKPRQTGMSTFTGAYAYWMTTTHRNFNTFILSHASDTTDALFEMTKRFHYNCPDEVRPDTDAISFKRIRFSDLDSAYAIGTAGSQDVGRGRTIQFFHGSEVAFWNHAESHFDGVMEAIPSGKDAQGTCVILESTANGQSGKFYELCMDAIKGDSEYELVFFPWFWMEDYSLPVPEGWVLPDEDIEEQQKYGLTLEQMYWRHLKRKSKGSDWRFKQEYPSNIMEAFQTSGEESFISPELVAEIRIPKPDIIVNNITSPRIGACDPAWTGDRTSIGFRVDKRVVDIRYYHGKDTVEVAQICADYIKEHHLDRLFVDVIGIGAGVYADLKHWGLGHIVKPVNFAKASTDVNPDGTKKYLNVRAQCWGRMREDMEEGPYEIPNLEELCADLMAPQYHYNNTAGALQLESKKDMKSRGVSSPDGGDTIAMTYAEPVSSKLNLGRDYDTIRVITEYNALEF